MRRTFIFDLEGTLAISNWRESWIPNWDRFHELFPFDRPNITMINLLGDVYAAGHNVVILTGKMDNNRKDAEAWLRRWGVSYSWLEMRKAGDVRRSTSFKEEYVLKFPKDEIAMIFDDREDIIKHFDMLGYPTYKVEVKL